MVRGVLLLVMAVHGVLSAMSWSAFGFAGFFPPFEDVHTTQIFSDLVICSSLRLVAIARVRRERGEPAGYNLPLLVGTALSGSFSPLCYFLWRLVFLERVLLGRPAVGGD